jgi:hypothetical protein
VRFRLPRFGDCFVVQGEQQKSDAIAEPTIAPLPAMSKE